jgi:hypothetical protein
MKTVTYPFKVADFQCFIINDASKLWKANELIKGAMTQEQLAQVALDFELDLDRIQLEDNNLQGKSINYVNKDKS